MAPKRPLPSENPPPASSDEEESSASSGDEEPEEEEKGGGRESGESETESESDDEDNKEQEKPPQPPKSSPPPPPPPQQKSQVGSSSTATGSESKSESESESEAESESRRYTVKPIASKPMEKIETPPAKKQRPEPSPSSKQPSAKRKVEVEDSKKESKKGKKKDVAENGSLQKSAEESKKPAEESKKPMFQRIWGDNDEIALLQGMIDFREKKGMDPSANTSAFHDYVKKSLGQEFSDSQLMNKIRVLKKKYSTNEGKGKDGEDRAFTKPHEQKVFELSKKIWGANKNSDAGGSAEQTPLSKANGTAKRSKTAAVSKVVPVPKTKSETSQERPKENGGLIPFEHGDTVGMLSCDNMKQISRIGLDEDFLKKGWEMLDESKREELKKRWRKLQLAEMQVLAERAELIQYQTNLFIVAYHQASEK